MCKPFFCDYNKNIGAQQMSTNKILGSALISIGTSIGAGILALPMVSAASGFLLSAALIIGIWVVITLSALLVLEVNLACPRLSCSFDSMTQKTLGKSWRIIVWVTLLCMHYALLAAYSSGATVLLNSLFHNLAGVVLPNWVSAILFVGTLGGAVFWGTRVVDYTNRLFISVKGLLLIASIVLLMPHVDLAKIIGQQATLNSKYLGNAAPIFLGAFGFLATIPSLRIYVGDKRKELRLIILCSTTVPLLIYLLWLLVNLGVVPLVGNANSFAAIKAAGGSVAQLIDTITAIVKSDWLTVALRGFSNISMTTSFLGVALGLFDFLADGCKRVDTRLGRLQTALLTFVPPLIFALFYPRGFIVALGYAAVFMAVLEVIMPALMAYKLQQQNANQATANATAPAASKFHRLLFNKFLLMSIAVVGVAIIVLQIIC
jgi:tyrosine-specific transport protein